MLILVPELFQSHSIEYCCYLSKYQAGLQKPCDTGAGMDLHLMRFFILWMYDLPDFPDSGGCGQICGRFSLLKINMTDK